MKIHIVDTGDSIRSVAERYGVPESRILFDNALDPQHKLCCGQTLIIGEPIRTDSVRGGDTVKRIADRNGTDVLTLLQNNPHLDASGLVPSQPLNIEFQGKRERKLLVHAYTGGADPCVLQKRLPLISVLSVQNAVLLQNGKVQLLDIGAKSAALARGYHALPVLCAEPEDAYGRADTGAAVRILSAPDLTERFIRSVLDAVEKGGFAGIELAFPPVPSGEAERLNDLLCSLSGLCEERGLYLLSPWLPNLAEPVRITENRADIADLVPVHNYLFDDEKSATPAAPLDRIETVFAPDSVRKYAGKLLLGIPTFGVDYMRAGCGYRKRAVDANRICQTKMPPPTVLFDPSAQAPYATYTEDLYRHPTEHILCFEDARSFAAKLAFADRCGLCGISICALDYDAPLLWQLLSQTCNVAKYESGFHLF